ncbi:MAG TPA: maltose alpha-D-glucosyltransferase [candidate division Zixibacteria bacterium]|nr:maltose alpha-D-glucosyltransferase [candidate division Zixibacteria bacterium]
MKTDIHWYQHAVFYELYLRAYSDSKGDGNGDFQGAISKLDYIKSLGVDCIWIMPTYPSPLKDDGYDIADYMSIHSDYGTLDDFKEFIEAAHDKGLRVVTDLVMNHTSDQHPWFQAARNGPDSPYHDYYVWSETGKEYGDARIIFLDYEESNWTLDQKAGKYFWHRFFSHQPDLNYENPTVQNEMIAIMRFWLDMGIDGFRADAVPYLFEREGTNCENLPETHAFLKKIRRILDEEYPARVLIAEANQWPEDVRQYFGDGDEFHMCFNFPIMPRLYMALKRGQMNPIVDVLGRMPEIPPGTQWMTFLRNHDELTLEMVTRDEREWMWSQYAPEPRMKQNMGIRRRLLPLLDGSKRKWLLMNALLFSLPGTPIIYYGDEIGMGDNIWLKDRNGCRTPMQWSGEVNGGFSRADSPYLPAIDSDQYGYKLVNVEDQEKDKSSFLWATRFLLEARNQHSALKKGTMELISIDNPALLAFWRVHDDDRILVLVNLSDQQQSISLELSAYRGSDFADLLSDGQKETLSDIPLVKILPPYAAHWFSLSEKI